MKFDFQEYVNKTMGRLDFEVALLHRWFKQDFPEARLEVHVDMDQIKREMTIQTRVLTGEEMSDNRGSFFSRIPIKETEFMDPSFMDKFLRVFNEQMRSSISSAINVHYHNEKHRLVEPTV